jgi:hypothetical protein
MAVIDWSQESFTSLYTITILKGKLVILNICGSRNASCYDFVNASFISDYSQQNCYASVREQLKWYPNENTKIRISNKTVFFRLLLILNISLVERTFQLKATWCYEVCFEHTIHQTSTHFLSSSWSNTQIFSSFTNLVYSSEWKLSCFFVDVFLEEC